MRGRSSCELSGNASNTTAFKFAQLYRSDDLGATWNFTGVEFSGDDGEFGHNDYAVGDNGVFALNFAQFGKGYEGSRDDFVYIYAPEIIDPSHWDIQKPGKIALMRVPKDQIENESSYEFFAGMSQNDTPTWTDDTSSRAPVWEDAVNGTHRMAVSYNAGLDRYFLTTRASRSLKSEA